jgi:hypothetical protein
MPKMTIPAPSTLHFRQGRSADQQGDLSGPRRILRRRRARPTARRSARSTTPAAAICSLTTPPGRCPAIPRSANIRASAATTRKRCRSVMRASPTPRSKASRRTWSSPCIPAAAISAPPSSRRAATSSSPSSFSAIPRSTAISSNTTVNGRRLRAAALFSEGQEAAGARLVTSKSGALEKQGRHQAPHRRGDQIRRARSALPVAAMRLCLDRRGQRPDRRRAMGEAAARGRTGRRSLGLKGMRKKRAALSGRSRRQSAAHGKAQDARERHLRAARSAAALKEIEDRRDRRRHPQARRCGTKVGDRRRISARVMELSIFSNGSKASNPTPASARSNSNAGAAAARRSAARHRQTRRLRSASDGRALQVSQGHTRQTAKVTIPSPSSLHFRYGRDAVPERSIRRWKILSRSRRVLPPGGAGLRRRRLPLSAARRSQPRLSVRPVAARATHRGARRRSGDSAGDLCRLINAGDFRYPADMTITMHLCRGNFRSSFVASGGYEPVAEILFNSINVHGYFHGIRQRPRRRL